MNIEKVIKEIELTKKFPILYKFERKKKKNNVRIWKIEVTENDTGEAITTTSSGLQDMKIHVKSTPTLKGVNIGKKNEKTAFEAAFAKAITKFREKAKSMSLTVDEDMNKKEDIFPMLLKDYNALKTNPKLKMKYPCFLQRKYDGIRCLVNIELLED